MWIYELFSLWTLRPGGYSLLLPLLSIPPIYLQRTVIIFRLCSSKILSLKFRDTSGPQNKEKNVYKFVLTLPQYCCIDLCYDVSHIGDCDILWLTPIRDSIGNPPYCSVCWVQVQVCTTLIYKFCSVRTYSGVKWLVFEREPTMPVYATLEKQSFIYTVHPFM